MSRQCVLSLNGWLNPAKSAALAPFIREAFQQKQTASADSITEKEWKEISAKLAPRKSWLAGKPAGNINNIPLDRLTTYQNKKTYQDALDLIEKDASVKKEIDAYAPLRKLILYQTCVLEFVNNFINLSSNHCCCNKCR